MKKSIQLRKNALSALTCLVVTVGSSLAGSDSAKLCNDYLHQVRVRENISGLAVAFEQHGERRYFFAEGDAEEGMERFTKETPLAVASITKVFVSTLIVKLMEEGRLSIYDKVQTVIPEFPFDNVFLHQLMTHTSGCHATQGYNLKKKALFYQGLTQAKPVGAEFAYFSSGYNILGDIVERTSGKTLQDYAQVMIFDKLDMRNTRMTPHIGESGMWTTTEDLLKFSRHLLDIHKTRKAGILKPFSVDFMFREITAGRFDRTPAFFLKSQTRVFGGYYGDLNAENALGHAGATGCFLLLDPTYDLSIVILSNGSKTIQKDDANFVKINNLMMGQFAK